MDRTLTAILLVATIVAAVVAGAAIFAPTEQQPNQPQTSTQESTNPQQGSTAAPESHPTHTVAPTVSPTVTPTNTTPVTTPAPENTTAPEVATNVTETTPASSSNWGDSGSDSSTSYYRTVTDMNGDSVRIPSTVHRVVTLYTPAAAMVMAIDGDAERLAGIDYFASIDDGFQTIDPSISEVPVVSGTGIEVNKEAILAVHPDVIIAGSWSSGGLEEIGVPVVYLNTNGFEDVTGALTVIGSVLNKNERAEELASYLDDHRSALVEMTAEIPEADQDNAYITWRSPLHTFAGGEFHSQWAHDAGCRFASEELVGHRQEVNFEQVATWNPDVIILSNNGDPEALLSDPTWQEIEAVQHGKVYRIPRFVGDWGSPVPESILGMEWLANGTYPDTVDLDMVAETQDFYSLFYDYDLSEEEAREVMGPTPAPHVRTVTVIDGAGREVELELPVERVVTNYPLAASMILTLGEGEHLAGVDEFTREPTSLECQIDARIADLPSVGFPWDLNTEQALALNPDLVLVPGWNGPGHLDELEDLGLPVYGLVVENDDQIKETMTDLGKALECEDTAQAFVDHYNDAIEAVTSRTGDLDEAEKPKVYFAGKGGILCTCNPGMYQHHLILEAGGIDVAGELPEGGWTSISAEDLATWNPDIILLAGYSGTTPEEVLTDERFQNITAVENGQVYPFPSNICGWDCPGTQTSLGLEWLAKALHPDLFGDIDVTADADAFYEEFYGTSFTELGGTLPATNFPGNAAAASAPAPMQATV